MRRSTIGAERETNANLFATRCSSGEHQVRNIRARDQQHEADNRHRDRAGTLEDVSHFFPATINLGEHLCLCAGGTIVRISLIQTRCDGRHLRGRL